MSVAAVRVKCKDCGTPIPVGADSPRIADDLGTRYRLVCRRCRKDAIYWVGGGVPPTAPAPAAKSTWAGRAAWACAVGAARAARVVLAVVGVFVLLWVLAVFVRG